MKVAIVYHSETGNTRKMAELIREGCLKVQGVEAKVMSVDDLDRDFLKSAQAVLLGCPTYEGSPSWQMKKFLDTVDVDLSGKLGGVFVSQNWPGGGGADFAEMVLIAGMLVRGMLIYSGGITRGYPYLHFGAVSARSPEGLYAERCLKLGENVASKAKELFG
ncbi:MAG: flavodoxin [Candidatus Latescibacterota bacterium]|nr:MAG: flavodoxin [Candidatus Latescibacterota bacterium]RKY74448.1 MAG: flavodoxin [Candidatus Latescibacterota bacterium]